MQRSIALDLQPLAQPLGAAMKLTWALVIGALAL